GDLPLLGDDERDWLVVEQDLVAVEGAKWRALGRELVLVGLVALRHGRAVLVREHGEYAGNAQCLARIDMLDAALGNGRCDPGGVRQPLRVVLGGVFRRPRDFRAAVDAGRWRADIGHCRLNGSSCRTAIAACLARPA